MASIKGTQTEINLMTSFAGESQARNRYTFFASQARKDGFMLVSDIFTETAAQEKEHAERMFNCLEGGAVEIKAAFPAGVVGSTLDNLLAAAAGEGEERKVVYPAFAKTAREEGFEEIAVMYEMIAIAETHHEARYAELAKLVKSGAMFKNADRVAWRCRNCGFYTQKACLEAPEICPACKHPRAYFERLAQPW
ncbi:MAG: rubrerythrin family protein [Kiritimatiellaeota bacterium]|nr:rubrerythrin family protein [Kiritimatiellota bacterium]